jgi:PAS domain S-box-containing protein
VFSGIDAVVHAGLVEATEYAASGVVVTDTKGLILFVNPAFCVLTGYSREEVVGQTPNLVKSGRQPQEFYDEMWETIAAGKTWHGELINRRKDGFLYTEEMRIVPIPDGDGTIAGYVGIKKDVTEHRSALETERLLSALVESSADAIVVQDREATILTWNRAAEEILGYTAAEAIGKNWSMMVVPERWHLIRQGMDRVLRGELFQVQRGVAVCKDGHLIPVSVRSWPIRNHLGEIVAISTNLRNVAQQDEAEKMRALLAAVVESSADAIGSGALDGTILSWNRSAEQLLGYSSAELIGKKFSVLVHEARLNPFTGILERVARGERIPPYDTVLMSKSGAGVPTSLSIFPLRDSDGTVVGASGIAHDLRPRIETERKLRASEEQFRKVFEEAPYGISVVGMDGRYRMVNKAFCQIVGYRREALLQMTWMDLTIEDDLPTSQRMVDQLEQEPGETAEWEKRYLRSDGNEIWVRLKICLLHDGQGAPAEMVIHVEDVTSRREGEEQLRNVTERLSLATRAGGVGVWDYDVEHSRVEWDDQMLRLYGMRREDFTGSFSDWKDELHPEDRESTEQAFAAAIRGEKDFDAEFRVVWPDESIHTIRALGKIKRLATGHAMHVIGTNWDITEQKRVEKELRESEERYHATFDQAGVGIIHTGLDGRILLCNRRFAEIVGYTPEEVLQATFQQITLPDDLESSLKTLGQLIDGSARVPSWEKRYVCKDGSIAWVRLTSSVLRDSQGKPLHFISIVEDIHEQKKAEASLREARERSAALQQAVLQLQLEAAQQTNDLHRLILEAAGEGIYGFDSEGRITFANPSAGKMLGYAAEEMIGQQSHEMHHHFCADGTPYPLELCPMFLTLRDGVIHSSDSDVFWRKDGSSIPVAFTSTPIVQQGQTTGVVVVFQETSERKRREAADTANQAKSEFLANMSHEIRNPMNGVIGMTGLLLETELTAEQRRYAETVRASGDTLLALINDILDFSKIEARRLELESVEFELPELLSSLTATVAAQAYAKGFELIACADPEVPKWLQGDPGRLRQILTNLLGNAVKFTRKGEVVLRVSVASAAEGDCLLRFSVRDTGIGIPEDKLGMVFDKFSQVEVSTTRRFGGTGLGLAISRQLVEMMGGHLEVKSEFGEGSEFWFTLHMAICARSAEAPNAGLKKLSGARVLIVDDNASSREMISRELAAFGMRRALSQSGPGALKALRNAQEDGDRFGLAVIDLQMPGMDGEALGRAIQADARLADTSIVMLTPLGARRGAERCRQAGFAYCVNKPLHCQELLDALCRAAGGNGGCGQIAEAEQQAESAARLRPTVDQNARILVAEDNFTNQQVVVAILKKLGLRADTVADGNEVLKSLATIPYDLVFMDMRMPVMDGVEATRQIRDQHSGVLNHAVPIVAMTANVMQSDQDLCMEAGMNGFVSKPISPLAVQKALEMWLPRSAQRGAKDATTVRDPARASGILAAAPADLPVFDRESVMERMMGDQELVSAVIEGFLASIPHEIDVLKEMVASADAHSAGRQAHSIKGAAANVGGERMRQVALAMERAADEGNLTAVNEKMEELDAQFLLLREALGYADGQGIKS